MREFFRSERGVSSAFRSLTEPPALSPVEVTRSGKRDGEPKARWISSDDARGSLSPEEGSRGDTLVPMLVWGLVLIVLAIGAVYFFA
jgi:hypothetical protein